MSSRIEVRGAIWGRPFSTDIPPATPSPQIGMNPEKITVADPEGGEKYTVLTSGIGGALVNGNHGIGRADQCAIEGPEAVFFVKAHKSNLASRGNLVRPQFP